MAAPRVLVLGGGFGGVYVARRLARAARRGEIELTVLSRSASFLFTPLLPEVATGGLSDESIAVPLRQAFPRGSARVLVGEALSVDAGARVVRAACAGGCVLELPYDYLVVALGSRAHFFDVPGAAERALPLKTLEDARRTRAAIVEVFERAARERRAPAFAVVGGGPTGVELAAELAELCEFSLEPAYPEVRPAEIALLSSGGELLPMLLPKGRDRALAVLVASGVEVRLGAKVAEVGEREVRLASGETVPADLTLWAAGVSPAPIPEGLGVALDPSGRVAVDASLRAGGHDNIFVLGDQAAGAPMLAQAAAQQAPVVAAGILAAVRGHVPRRFTFRPKGALVSLGRWRAVGQVGRVTVSGPLAWWLWRTVYLFKFPSWRKRLRVGAEWAIGLFFPRDVAI